MMHKITGGFAVIFIGPAFFALWLVLVISPVKGSSKRSQNQGVPLIKPGDRDAGQNHLCSVELFSQHRAANICSRVTGRKDQLVTSIQQILVCPSAHNGEKQCEMPSARQVR